jgi:hypothetical protein
MMTAASSRRPPEEVPMNQMTTTVTFGAGTPRIVLGCSDLVA